MRLDEEIKALDWRDASTKPSDDDIGKLFWIHERESDCFFCYTPVIYNGDWVCPITNKVIPYSECTKWFKIPVESKLYSNIESDKSHAEIIKWYSPLERLPALVSLCSSPDGHTMTFSSSPLTIIADMEFDGKHHYKEWNYVFYRSDGNWYHYIDSPRPVLIQSGSDKLKLNVVYWTYTLSVGGNLVRALKRGDIH